MGWFLEGAGRKIIEYLDRPASGYEPFTPSDPKALLATIKIGDILLVEGNSHISGAIKYLTQSTWSHAALYVGRQVTGDGNETQGHALVEATLEKGVASVPLSKYFRFHTRICRPIDLSIEDCEAVCKFAVDRIGYGYDHKNIVDLARYLIPLPVPQRWRRKMIALGSGDPTRFICSGMIAQAFQSIHYPILPAATTDTVRSELLRIRHSSLFVPRDFDISPFFEVVKPTIERGFDYRRTRWGESLSDQSLSTVERQTAGAIPGDESEAPPRRFGGPTSCGSAMGCVRLRSRSIDLQCKSSCNEAAGQECTSGCRCRASTCEEYSNCTESPRAERRKSAWRKQTESGNNMALHQAREFSAATISISPLIKNPDHSPGERGRGFVAMIG